jgi:Bacteriophage tail sheath protein
MPSALTYPGVYIEEIPSGVRTITGVATSITAFIGRALRGPVNKARTINSFGDFERIFGGLWVDSSLGYAVRDFFLNGGTQAVVVRLFHAESGQGATPSKASLTVGGLNLEALYEGAWGKNLRAETDTNVSEEVAKRLGLTKNDLFNLTVREVASDGQVVNSEVFLNV